MSAAKREGTPPDMKMVDVVIHENYGGIRVRAAYGPYTCDHRRCRSEYGDDVCRTHPDFVRAVREDGPDAVGGPDSGLAIVQVPAGAEFAIQDYDGYESLHNFLPKRGLGPAATARVLEWIRRQYSDE